MGRAGDEVGEHRTGAFMGRMEVWTSCCRASRTSAGLWAVAEQNQVFISKSHSDNRAGEEVAYLPFLQTVLTEHRENKHSAFFPVALSRVSQNSRYTQEFRFLSDSFVG